MINLKLNIDEQIKNLEEQLWYNRLSEGDKKEVRRDLKHKHEYFMKEYELKELPLTEKIKRYSKNIGIETLATTIESFGQILTIGGMHINCDELRERKEETLYSFRKNKATYLHNTI